MGASNFLVEQLNTKISIMKSHLACPVCFYNVNGMQNNMMSARKVWKTKYKIAVKSVLHMHQKFSEKDVEDVWF